jgi:hypothetical protein
VQLERVERVSKKRNNNLQLSNVYLVPLTVLSFVPHLLLLAWVWKRGEIGEELQGVKSEATKTATGRFARSGWEPSFVSFSTRRSLRPRRKHRL